MDLSPFVISKAYCFPGFRQMGLRVQAGTVTLLSQRENQDLLLLLLLHQGENLLLQLNLLALLLLNKTFRYIAKQDPNINVKRH